MEFKDWNIIKLKIKLKNSKEKKTRISVILFMELWAEIYLGELMKISDSGQNKNKTITKKPRYFIFVG